MTNLHTTSLFEGTTEDISSKLPTTSLFEDVIKEEEEKDKLPTTSLFGENQEEKDKLPTTSLLQTDYADDDPDSFLNIFFKAYDTSQRDSFKAIKLFAEEAQEKFPETSAKVIEIADKGIAKNQKQIDERRETKPIQMPDESFMEFKKSFNEGDYKTAFLELAKDAKRGTAEALGQFAPYIATGAAATLPGSLFKLGTKGQTILGVLGFTLPASLPSKSSTYEEAISLGATEEDARKYSNYGYGITAALGSFIPSYLIAPFLKSIGKDATVKFIKKDITDELSQKMSKKSAEKVGKEITDELIDKAEKGADRVIINQAIKPSVLGTAIKRGTTAGIAGGVIEAAQERAQIGAAGLASPERTISPYSEEDINRRLINAGVLGLLGDKSIGTFSGAVEGMNLRSFANEFNEQEINEAKLDKLYEKETLENELTDAVRGKRTDDKKSFGLNMLYNTSMAPLNNFSQKSKGNREVYNDFVNYYNKLSQRVGQEGTKIRDALDESSKALKVPLFSRALSKKDENNIYELLNNFYPNKKYSKKNIASAEAIRDVTGRIEKPEVNIDTNTLFEYVATNSPVLPEVNSAFREGRISQDDYDFIYRRYNRLINKYNKEFRQRIEKPIQEGTFDNEFYDQELGKVKSLVLDSNDFKKIVENPIAPVIATGIAQNSFDEGISFPFQENYFTAMYKINTKKQQEQMKQILRTMQPEDFGGTKADVAIENMTENNGFYVPNNKKLRLENVYKDDTVTDFDKDFQKPRVIKPETRRALYEAGLTETNVKKVLEKYVLDSSHRIEIAKLANKFNRLISDKRSGDLITKDEMNQLQDVFQALQNNHQPIRGTFKDVQRNIITYQYMLTLPAAALTSLTEPLIVLSRVRPTDAIFGGIEAARNVLRQGLRSIFPKLPYSKKERAFRSLLEGFDGTLAERLGSIEGVDISRRVTDKFFKIIGLTQVTQFSRDIAYNAGSRQIKVDIIDYLKDIKLNKNTKGGLRARKRLAEIGLTKNNIQSKEMLDFIEGRVTEPPRLFQQAMARFVREIIMAPNVVNRPLWMSNPIYASLALLKGFMFTFGLTIMPKIWRELFKPMVTLQRLPVEAAVKYTLAFGLIVAGTMGIREIKDYIRYDGDGPYQDLSIFQKIIDAILRSNVFGPGTALFEASHSYKYGASPLEVLLGPVASQLSALIKAMGQVAQGSFSSISRFFVNSLPFFSALSPKETKDKLKEITENILKNLFQ